MKVGAAVLWGVALMWGTLSCFNPFAPELTQSLGSGDLIVTEQRSPEEVLQNFKVAYTFRDSLLYADLIDTAFVFRFFNPEASSSGLWDGWRREEDLKTTGRLFRYFELVDLVWNATIYAWAEEEEAEICRGFQLHLSGAQSDYSVNGRAVFTFRRSGDEKWRIVRWEDESEI